MHLAKERETGNKRFANIAAAIAQWIRLRLPSCSPGFKSQAHRVCFYLFIFELCNVKMRKLNTKMPGMAHIKTV